MSSFDDLLAALTAVPRLDGARCRGRWELWDETIDPEVVEYTVNQCRGCPALNACENYLAGVKPSKRPAGVVAGRIIPEPKSRKKSA